MTTVLPTPDFTCPNCDGTVTRSRDIVIGIPYGAGPNVPMITFNTVVKCCIKCGATFTGPDYEKHQEAAVTEHQLKTLKFSLQTKRNAQTIELTDGNFPEIMAIVSKEIWNAFQATRDDKITIGSSIWAMSILAE